MVEGNKYTTDTLNELPDAIKPEKTVIKTENRTTLFFRQDAFLSNFHPSTFELDGKTYNCVEQYYCSQKARCFGDREKKVEIMCSTNPREMKFLGGRITGFNQQFWGQKQIEVMHKAVGARFTQNQDLAKKFLETGDNTLAEASARDTYWGTGVSMFEKNAFNQKAWSGSNHLGNIIMKVRDNLKGSS